MFAKHYDHKTLEENYPRKSKEIVWMAGMFLFYWVRIHVSLLITNQLWVLQHVRSTGICSNTGLTGYINSNRGCPLNSSHLSFTTAQKTVTGTHPYRALCLPDPSSSNPGCHPKDQRQEDTTHNWLTWPGDFHWLQWNWAEIKSSVSIISLFEETGHLVHCLTQKNSWNYWVVNIDILPRIVTSLPNQTYQLCIGYYTQCLEHWQT